jgi:hypothetical protein
MCNVQCAVCNVRLLPCRLRRPVPLRHSPFRHPSSIDASIHPCIHHHITLLPPSCFAPPTTRPQTPNPAPTHVHSRRTCTPSHRRPIPSCNVDWLCASPNPLLDCLIHRKLPPYALPQLRGFSTFRRRPSSVRCKWIMPLPPVLTPVHQLVWPLQPTQTDISAARFSRFSRLHPFSLSDCDSAYTKTPLNTSISTQAESASTSSAS